MMTRFSALAATCTAVVAVGLSACGNGPPPTDTSSSGTSSGTSGKADTHIGTAKVKVQATEAQKFVPGDVTVTANDIVEWDVTGGLPHNVTFDDASLSSSNFNAGDSWQVQFTKPGDYAYKCTIHAGMSGVVHVK